MKLLTPFSILIALSAIMEKVWAAGRQGLVGFQGFGIQRDPRGVLAETMAAWRKIIGQR